MDIKEVRSIVKGLTSSERKELLKRFKSSSIEGNEIVSFKLIDLLVKSNLNYEELQIALYGRLNRVAIDKLLNRLVDRISETIVLRENIEDSTVYDIRSRDIFLLKKELVVAELFRFRGFVSISRIKIDKVIQKSEYYEHYDILVNALEMLRKWTFLELSSKELEKIDKSIVHFNTLRIYQREVYEIFVVMSRSKIELSASAYILYLKNNKKLIDKYFIQTKSKSIKYFGYFTDIEFYSKRGDFRRAIEITDEMLSYITINKNIYSVTRHANILINKSLFYRYLFQFDVSIQVLLEAKKFIYDQEYTNILYYEQLYITYYYGANVSKMKYYIQIIEEEIRKIKVPMLITDRLSFHVAIFYFINSNFIKCARFIESIVSSNSIVEFNIEVKLLTILTSIELGKFDLAESMIENLMKYYSRLKIVEGFELKGLEIKILNKLVLSSFDYKSAKEGNKGLFIDLERSYSSYNFREFHYIPFHEWFDSKLKGIPYNHVEAMSRLKKANKQLN